MKKIAIIGGGKMAGIFAKKAKELHVKTYCFAWAKGAVAKDYVDYFYDISIFEKERILEICKENHIQGVIATTELTIAIASYLANEMRLNANSVEMADKITNKYWVREHNRTSKVFSQPLYSHLTCLEDMNQLVVTQYPVIVKPVAEGGKRGITVVDSQKKLRVALLSAFEADRKKQGVLIEKFLDGGKEYSVEGLSYHGQHQIIQVTEKMSSGPPHCVELGHSQPAELSLDFRNKVEEAVKELLDNVGLQNGPTHTEIKIIKGNVYLIELNARPGGDHIAYPLTELSTGYDYIAEIIKVAVDQEPKKISDKTHIMYAGVRFVAQQTAYLQNVLLNCHKEKWFYEKHIETTELNEISHNDGFHLNYFIYCDEAKPKLYKQNYMDC